MQTRCDFAGFCLTCGGKKRYSTPSAMPQTETTPHNEKQLAGQWVAVAQPGSGKDAGPEPVLVDFDPEIDRLCQRLAASGRSGLTIFRYPSS